ncbi:MAG: hypothetical protein U0R17_00315 [Acidimicrobiia bacterium]
MEIEKKLDSPIVKISVHNNPDLNFFFDLGSNSVVSEQESQIFLSIDKETYERLLNGDCTFEMAVSEGSIRISGDIEILRTYGKTLRNSTELD